MKKVRRAAPQALVALRAALRALYVKILRQNRCFLAPPRLAGACFCHHGPCAGRRILQPAHFSRFITSLRQPWQESGCSNIFETSSADMAHAARARHQMCACGKKKAGKSQKAYTPPGVSCAIFGFIFLVFPLTARFFRLIMLIMYHHGLVCPCAKKMPKIFVHFDDFCPGRRAALRGVTKKRNMLKK